MVKSSGSSEKTPLKKGAWSSEEDRKLINYIKKYKIWNWSEMAKAAGLARSGKSCRLRWVNYLRPDIKHGNFSAEEVETVMALHETLGNRWATIASKLPGRTDNEVKNYWHTHLKKRLSKSNPNTSAVKATESQTSKDTSNDEISSPKTISESESLLFSPGPEESSKLDKLTDANNTIESPKPMCIDDFPSPPTHISSLAPLVNCKTGQEQGQNAIVDNQGIFSASTTETFGQESQSLWTQQQQQQQQQEVEIDHHEIGELNLANDYSLAGLFEPNSLVGPSGSEIMWQHESMWTYDHFCEDVCNDYLDYMDPIF